MKYIYVHCGRTTKTSRDRQLCNKTYITRWAIGASRKNETILNEHIPIHRGKWRRVRKIFKRSPKRVIMNCPNGKCSMANKKYTIGLHQPKTASNCEVKKHGARKTLNRRQYITIKTMNKFSKGGTRKILQSHQKYKGESEIEHLRTRIRYSTSGTVKRSEGMGTTHWTVLVQILPTLG